MAKTPNPKHHKASLHSRASRRASSPALEGNLDKSLRSVPRPSSPKPNIVLAPRNGAGVTKGNRKGGKVLKRKQRVRVEMGRERAENVGGKMERKVRRAEMRGEGRRGRNVSLIVPFLRR